MSEAAPGNARRASGWTRAADYVFLTRPMILVPVWTFYLLGAAHGAAAGGSAGRGRLFAGLLSFTLLVGAAYVVNQIADRDTDRERGKLHLVPHGLVTAREAWIEAALLAAGAFAIAAAFLPAAFLALLGASLVLGAAYSLEPVRLKGLAVLDVLANAVGNGVLNTAAGWVAAGAPGRGWEILLPYAVAVASVHLVTTLADRGADARSGLRTSGVALGVRGGLALSAALMAAAAAAARIAGNGHALLASLLSIPFFLLAVRGGKTEPPPGALLAPAKAATLVFSVVAGFLFPPYLPALAAVVVLTRLYYARRFGIRYPSLGAS